jgi:hypothetical protein
MRGHERSLKFTELPPGGTASAQCSLCKRAFHAKPLPGERYDNTLLRIRRDFDDHNCHLDSSRNVPGIDFEAGS